MLEAHKTWFLPPSSHPFACIHRCPEFVLLHITGVRDEARDPTEQAEARPPAPHPTRSPAIPGPVRLAMVPPFHRQGGGCQEGQRFKGTRTVRATQQQAAMQAATGHVTVCPDGDLRTAGPAGPQIPAHPSPGPGSGRRLPRRHTPQEAREGDSRGALWTPNQSVCCSSSGQSPLNKNDPHVLVFV